MKKKILCFILIVLLLTIAFLPWQKNTAHAPDLELDVSSGQVISHSDSHGGFHGDGLTYTVIAFSDDSFLRQIQSAGDWNALPLDEATNALIYGVTIIKGNTSFIRGPMTNTSGEPLFPQVQHGYYRFIDRQGNTETSILQRPSSNYSLGIYDVDCNTLYYCEFDT